MGLAQAYRVAGYYLTLALFAAGGLLVNLIAVAAFWVPRTARSERFFQRLIHRAFRLFIGWMALVRLGRVRYEGELAALPGGLVLVANHPGLMDITYLLAQLPEAVCLFKPAIRRNPILGAAAVRAGYLISSDGVDTVRQASDKVADGNTVVIFPEGTRTPPGAELGPLRPGFALIARRAAAPVQVLRIACNSNALSKGCPWWKPPHLPIDVSIALGPRFEPEPGDSTTTLADRVAASLRPAVRGTRRPAGAAGLAGTPEIHPC